jgi:hypothetical protein
MIVNETSHRRHVVEAFLLLAGFLATETIGVAGPPAPEMSEATAIERATRFYTSLSHLDRIAFGYHVDSTPTGVTERVFAWKWCDVELALKAPMMFSQFEHPQALTNLTKANQNELIRETYVWDGRIGMTADVLLASRTERRSVEPAHVGILAQPPRKLFDRDFFFQALSIKLPVPIPEQDVGLIQRFPKHDYWMPDAIVHNSSQYHLEKDVQTINGVRCRLLRREPSDWIWVSEETPEVVVRRQYAWPADGGLRFEFNYSDFAHLPGDVWLPRTILRQDYCAPWDKAERHNKVAYKLAISVSHIEPKELDDATFKDVKVPAGAECYDWRTESYFTNFSKTDDPLDAAVARAAQRTRNLEQKGQKNHLPMFLLVINVSLAVAVALTFYLRRRKAGKL